MNPKTFPMISRPEAGTVVVNDVSEREETRPADVLDAVDHDKRECDGGEEEPEEEVVHEGVVCEYGA